jgi:hypothetical protein
MKTDWKGRNFHEDDVVCSITGNVTYQKRNDPSPFQVKELT